MRVFDWAALLKEQRIPHIDSGANVKRGELAIRCPFCGSADPSMHMGLNLETGWWSCWRNRAQHSGKSPLRLIMKLLGVPYGRAREIAGLGEDYLDPEGFDAMAAMLMARDKTTGRKEETQRRRLYLDDPDFRIIEARGWTGPYFDYLVGRGFHPEDIDRLGREYGVVAAVRGEYANRIILPYFMDHELVTWTGRAIGSAKVRYKDMPLEADPKQPERASSILGPKETLFNHDAIYGPGHSLVLVEGPLDALKLDFYGKRYGIRAVALSTNSIQPAQSYLLQSAQSGFERVLVMLDNADKLDVVSSMRMAQELHFIGNVQIAPVPFGAKDAGDLSPDEVHEWAREQERTYG